MDRRRVVDEARRDELVPFLPHAVDRGEPRLRGIVGSGEVLARSRSRPALPQERPHVGHQAERHRIVAADLLGIDVDMDQFGRRDGEGIAGIHDDDVRSSKRTPSARRRRPAAPRRWPGRCRRATAAERQRMVGVDGADAAHRCATGICSSSASSSSSSPAPPYLTPWPTRSPGARRPAACRWPF